MGIISRAALGITLCIAVLGPTTSAQSRTIFSDGGGEVIRYALSAKRLHRRGHLVRFAGRCDSACTLYLSMPRRLTCISPGASFGFHRPYGASARNNAVAARYMMRSYPGWVRRWIRARGGLSSGIRTMPYAYARRHLRPCRSTRVHAFRHRGRSFASRTEESLTAVYE